MLMSVACSVRPAGASAESEIARLSRELECAAEGDAATVVLDLTRCASIASAALGALARAERRIRGNGRELMIVASHPATVRALRLAGFDRRLQVRIAEARGAT
jgi:anti-anti-sigma factor